MPKTEWPTCVDCGRQFEFLKVSQCGRCKDRDDSRSMPAPLSVTSTTVPLLPSSESQATNQDLHHAIKNPINPCTHGTSQAIPYFNPYQQTNQQLVENDPRFHNAQNVFQDYENGFTTAVHRAPPQTRVRRIFNRHDKWIVTPFDAQMISYEETRLWALIASDIIAWLDGIYSKVHGHRIRSSDDVSLWYTNGRVEGTTLKELWRASISQPGLLVLAKHIKNLTLELDAYVNYPVDVDDTDSDDISDESIYNGPKKRKAKQYVTEPNARLQSNKIKHNCRVKFSRISVKRHFNVWLKAQCKSRNFYRSPAKAIWNKFVESITILIDKVSFSSGKAKNTYKLRFTHSSTYYAAKTFFETGSFSTPSSEENLQHLKEELVRQLVIKDAISDFSKVAEQANIAVHDLQVADSFIPKVCKGQETGKCWLVDCLDFCKMRKFSGTNVAGENHDFVGTTCDAFAHFTLESGGTFIPVDIQGIDTEVMKEGLRFANIITLFDVMAHSKLYTMGLGDSGPEGMKVFCRQHKCNRICKKLKLTPMMKLIGDIDIIDDEALQSDSGSSVDEADELLGSASEDYDQNDQVSGDLGNNLEEV
ncbi:kinase-like domain-containing protein [Cyathus striatus]|nr:kinase-like domain-containing protein [Cyathus striatus]